MKTMKKLMIFSLILLSLFTMTSCKSDLERAQEELDRARQRNSEAQQKKREAQQKVDFLEALIGD